MFGPMKQQLDELNVQLMIINIQMICYFLTCFINCVTGKMSEDSRKNPSYSVLKTKDAKIYS